ncbi:MAG: aspartate ammonia-lyase [bacterium]|nr:MAG: aspartate ammonia-lyase [bacterium]
MVKNYIQTRTEQDSLGKLDIPADAYYGIQTFRALQNFQVSGIKPKKSYILATVQIKRAAAKVNKNLGLLEKDKADAIIAAADEVLQEKLLEWFVVDVFQAGAGTSHNMNTNEILTNRAIEILGGSKGEYEVIHPNDHVNMAQSTNDVIPTAIRLAAVHDIPLLLKAIKDLQQEFQRKAREFDSVLKSGRTHLQDAVPIRLGQEFGGWAANMGKHYHSIEQAMRSCLELGIGGTAAGTGLNAHHQYRELMVQMLSEQLNIQFYPAKDYFEAMQSMRQFVEISGTIRNLSQDLIRIANDLRLLSSGPKTGLAEIQLPAVQPGSSIMPGKVNPVMAEMLNMVCFQVIGCDTTILFASQAGQLELNVMMPVIAYNLLHQIEILANALPRVTDRCIRGITADLARCQHYAEESVSIATILNPVLGYQKTAKVVQESLKTGLSIREILIRKKLLTISEIDMLFDLKKMTEPGMHRSS